MSLLDYLDDESEDAVLAYLAEQVETLNVTERRRAVRTAPSDEPLSWPDRKTRLVRLDVAIIACHMFALRVGCKSVPGVLRQRLYKTLQTIGIAVGQAAAIRLFGQVAARVIAPIRLLWRLWHSDEEQIEYENAVRRAGITCQRELYLFRLSQRSKKRRRERVLTRHPIPKQRRKNGANRRKP